MNFGEIASDDSIERAVSALKEHSFTPYIIQTKAEALEKIKELIPQGASVMNGTSKTLEQIGYIEYLKAGEHGWNNLHELILAEPDYAKQGPLRKQATISDFYLGSVHALTETGSFIVASNTGSQLPGIVFNSDNLIFVVGAQKIVPDIPTGLERIQQYILPREDERMKGVYGFGTYWSKTLIYNGESQKSGRNFHILIVREELGF